MIETRLLRQFIAVAEELHFHRAAQRLNMAQPPLSQAIRRLEDELRVRLFVRSRRDVALTPAGVAFLDTARRTLAQLSEGADHARRVAAGVAGRLAVAFVDSANYDLLPVLLRSFREQSPDVTLVLQEATSLEQVEALREGVADLGLMRWPGVPTPGLAFERLAQEPIVAALPDDHPLARLRTVPLAHLAGEGFVFWPRHKGVGFHDQVVGLCRHAGFSPRIVQEARQMPTIVGLVAGGLGVALVPASLRQARRDGVAFRPLAVDAPRSVSHVDTVAAWMAARASPVREAFLAVARQVVAGETLKVSLAIA
ncbi:LysR family transcriptional regulator [Bradyrhizobium sp. U87765 SZCCT0131]|uniref:LysR family transcriptional regulator n=1 Tax=unclassified Bradyrhizobium TaxID=2631580 RepID=UPI001BAC9C65|nr:MULTISPECIES: LysR family transcriptional regulator [unclassified Bradyrhizobium]MBR1219286.1 LysR family transcriptional regulator [Bradyrhizobium sp. U87765 SZCCT0131]MBR1261937.1 LysR family transcriptional regulator [Bradyrhizobium sp. U87765 SZCCT0134]MBR1306210.1 LysR family transcriptional regulator [Bradyrhizobium sp. U87765 SZCCT0110]MBR1317719.1 LysR family transcriptional regulator [Bradyrhizobium sp. U87765 SZCCT0109]MBR1351421.1 LysR family transcriptional regulator [Bradyrhizo